jgi:hypothetical protein
MNLEEFAAATRATCPICGIEEQAEIEAAWEKGIRASTIMRWLVDVQGHDATHIDQRRIRNHFESGGHCRAAR